MRTDRKKTSAAPRKSGGSFREKTTNSGRGTTSRYRTKPADRDDDVDRKPRFRRDDDERRPSRSPRGESDRKYGSRPRREEDTDRKPRFRGDDDERRPSRSPRGESDRKYGSRPRREEDTDRKPRFRRDDDERRPSRSPRGESDRKYGSRPRREEDTDRKPRFRRDDDERRPSRSPRGESDRKYGSRPRREEDTDRKPRFRRDDDERRPSRSPRGESDRKYGSRPRRDDSVERPSRFKTSDEERPKRTSAKLTKPQGEEVRLNKFLSNSGLCSRREADEYITAGLVTVNGTIVTELGTKVKHSDDIRFNGERMKGEQKVYIVMNKPKDYVTTMSDPHAKHTVMDLISPEKCSVRVYPVGRLDKNTTGVLLLTNDGELADKLAHPSHRKKKIYHVHLDRNVKVPDLRKLVEGIELEDGLAQADHVEYVEGEKTQVGLEIHSGRNRIVRRMFEALDYKVEKLDRVYFAGLTKKNLTRGQWRFLTEQEVAALKMGAYE